MQCPNNLILLLLKSFFNYCFSWMKYVMELFHHCSVKGSGVRVESKFFFFFKTNSKRGP